MLIRRDLRVYQNLYNGIYPGKWVTNNRTENTHSKYFIYNYHQTDWKFKNSFHCFNYSNPHSQAQIIKSRVYNFYLDHKEAFWEFDESQEFIPKKHAYTHNFAYIWQKFRPLKFIQESVVRKPAARFSKYLCCLHMVDHEKTVRGPWHCGTLREVRSTYSQRQNLLNRLPK